MVSTILNIDGVPEHFNLPWRWIEQRQALREFDVTLRWTDVAEGTGRMIERLNEGAADIALLLTEGAVAGIARGGRFRILGTYVASPLQWGVHVAADSPFHDATALAGRRFAISRHGSGSHLMAAVYARMRQWPGPAESFVVVDNIDGARRALKHGEADIFLWERFTTKPYVDGGEFRCIDVLPTPWPCFVACASEAALADKATAARLALHAALHVAQRLASEEEAPALFAERYDLQPDDAAEWLQQTRWSATGGISGDILEQTGEALREVGMVDAVPAAQQLLA